MEHVISKNICAKLFAARLSDQAVLAKTIETLDKHRCAFVQFGANGVAEDRLQEQAVEIGVRCILVEPHPFYCGILRERYADSPNVRVIQNAADAVAASRRLYFVPPDLADEMDGSGPPNKWAHGQGSFDRRQVEYWIRANEFRWNDPHLTESYLSRISETEVVCRPAADIILDHVPKNEHCVVVIDTQGAESVILRGLFSNRDVKPILITYEDDRGFIWKNFFSLWLRGFRCLNLSANVTFSKRNW